MIKTYIIHERPFNDAKKYLLLFSKEKGMSATPIANKRQLHYFTPYQSLEGRRALSLQHPLKLHSPFLGSKLYCGLYLNELIYRFCKPHDPHPVLFDLYHQTLDLLRNNVDERLVLRHFELRLLGEIGYGIDIAHIKAPFIRFNKHEGFIGTHEPSEHTIAHHHLQNVLTHQIPSKEVKIFFRQILNSLLPSSLQARLFYEKVT